MDALVGVFIIRLAESMRHRPNQLICGVNGTPFVHVALGLCLALLLFFFSVPQRSHHPVGPDLPRVSHPVSMPHADREDAMVVIIARDHIIFFRGDRIGPDRLPAKIRESVKHGSENKVYIGADGRAKYGWVAEVLDGVRSAGVEKIGLLVYEKGPVPVPNPQ
jgi:biopolymer transport protein TolR